MLIVLGNEYCLWETRLHCTVNMMRLCLLVASERNVNSNKTNYIQVVCVSAIKGWTIVVLRSICYVNGLFHAKIPLGRYWVKYCWCRPILVKSYKFIWRFDTYTCIFPPLVSLLKMSCIGFINSSPLSAAYMRQWTASALVQVIACRLFGAKPLPEPMLPHCQLDHWEQTSVKFESKYKSCR